MATDTIIHGVDGELTEAIMARTEEDGIETGHMATVATATPPKTKIGGTN